jgi:hypothetical protein
MLVVYRCGTRLSRLQLVVGGDPGNLLSCGDLCTVPKPLRSERAPISLGRLMPGGSPKWACLSVPTRLPSEPDADHHLQGTGNIIEERGRRQARSKPTTCPRGV